MPITLKPSTIEILLKFAKNVNKRGLVGELPSPEKADEDETITYQDATILYEEIENLKKIDPVEWQNLGKCYFVEWSDPRTDLTGQPFEYWYDKVFKQNYCISAFKGTVARFLYEQVDSREEALLNRSQKITLMSQYKNDYFDLTWQIQFPPKIYIESISTDKPIASDFFKARPHDFNQQLSESKRSLTAALNNITLAEQTGKETLIDLKKQAIRLERMNKDDEPHPSRKCIIL